MYQNELRALKKAGRFRERKQFDTHLIDFASNDYLGLANDKKQFEKLCKMFETYQVFAPKASMLVNGYHPVHQAFEEKLCRLNGFESGMVVGSGFLANMALIDALVRKNSILFMDEEYHASGMMATGLIKERVVFFKHNDSEDLRKKMAQHQAKRQIIAIEGVYSMSGEICALEIFKIADAKGALLIVDEAHSSGVIGKNLLGVFEYYDIAIKENHIKMGTLGKAYGSYGAYILASREIVSFLENRAKPIIYSTAPSVIDTALALINLNTVSKKAKRYRQKIDKRLKMVEEILGVKRETLIVPIPVKSNQEAVQIQQMLIEKGFLVGAIRQPTVNAPIVRFIPRLGVSKKHLREMLRLIRDTSI